MGIGVDSSLRRRLDSEAACALNGAAAGLQDQHAQDGKTQGAQEIGLAMGADQKRRTDDAQPGTTSGENSHTHTTHTVSDKLPRKIATPRIAMTRSGTTENDVMPLSARDSILR